MAAAPSLDLDVVFRALQVPEEEWSSQVGLWGGGGGGSREAVAEVQAESWQVAYGPVPPAGWLAPRFPPADVTDLVVPQPPSMLATWLVRRRPELRQVVRESNT